MKNKILKIGITGHRDLKKSCIPYYQEQLNKLLLDLKNESDRIVVYSSLADGADRLIVIEAIGLGIEYVAVLPMSLDRYVMDFDDNSESEFQSLVHHAKDVITMPLSGNNTIEQISTFSPQRDLQYEASGRYLADKCDMLVALWDGKYIGLVGGTGEMVKYCLAKEKHDIEHLLVSRSKDVNNIMVEFMKL